VLIMARNGLSCVLCPIPQPEVSDCVSLPWSLTWGILSVPNYTDHRENNALLKKSQRTALPRCQETPVRGKIDVQYRSNRMPTISKNKVK